MAGEIEEPFSFNFQADSLHSGSISFGRFESESLSWERRSSFSHNRYLEEVEKCSKPGSVIEKKAYFEAHFRKKALLCQTSEGQNGTEYQTSSGDISDNINYQEEYENMNLGNSSLCFNESPDGSDNHEECEVIDYEREDIMNPYYEPQMEPALSNVDAVVEGDHKHDQIVETHLIQTRCDEMQLDSAELNTEVKEIIVEEAVNVNDVSRSTDSHPVRQAATEDISSSEDRDNSPQPMAAMETKYIKSKSKSLVNVTQSERNFPTKSIEDFVKSSCGNARQSSRVTKTVEQSTQSVIPTLRSRCRTPIPDVSRTGKAKLSHDSKSVKDLKTKKVVEPRSCPLENGESGVCQTLNRPKRIVKSRKPDIKSSPAIFNFKSEERAERRKEFSIKLEKKTHAKEAEMNQIQARTLEETEAEIRQFRKSLNFKAIPMPSFYHEATQPRSDKSKDFSISTKSTRLRSKSTSPGSRAATGSSAHQKAENDQAVSSNGSANATDSPQVSSATNCSIVGPCEVSAISMVPRGKRNKPLSAGMKIEVAGKKDRGKDVCTNLHKNQVSGGNKVIKGQRVKGKLQVGATSSNQIEKKELKGSALALVQEQAI